MVLHHLGNPPPVQPVRLRLMLLSNQSWAEELEKNVSHHLSFLHVFFFFLAFMVPWFPTPGLGQIWSQDDFISVTQKWEKSLPLSASKNPSDEPVWGRKISLWWNCSLVKTLLHFKGSHVKRFGNHYACSYSVHYLCKCTVCVCVEEDILYQPHQGKFTFFTWLLLLYTRVWNTHMQNQT